MKARITVLMIALLTFVSVMGSVSAATLTATVDFEGIAPGTTIASLASGNGVSGDAFPGSIVVLGDNSAQHVVGNAAMIFDALCGGDASGCTGNDTDLFAPELGNVMIISEDLNGANPDDNGGGGWLDFDLTGFGDGVFTVSNANIVDTEGGGRIDFFNGVTLLSTIALPELADGEQALVPFSVDGVTNFRVYITESGAIDNINLSVETPDEPDDECPDDDDDGHRNRRGRGRGHSNHNGNGHGHHDDDCHDHDHHDDDDCRDGRNGRDRDGRNGRNGRGNGHNYDNNNGHGNNHGNNNGRGRGNNGRSGRGRSN